MCRRATYFTDLEMLKYTTKKHAASKSTKTKKHINIMPDKLC